MRDRKRDSRLAVAISLSIALAGSTAHAGPLVGARHGIVASTNPLASRVGADVLARGGNAVDAAVAVAFALAVTWPAAGNLGGGGFMLIRRSDGRAEVIDYRERAPLAAARDMYLDSRGNVVPEASTVGLRAAGVPGTVAGLALAHRRHGALPWRDLVEPARRLAQDGFALDLANVVMLRRGAALLARFPESARLFLRDGKPPMVGDPLIQADLAQTLARISRDPRDFYTGETSRLLLEEMAANGGIITAKDLAGYEPTIRKPLEGQYRGFTILTMPPPSSGGAILLEMLHMLEKRPIGALGHNSADEIHLLVEVMRRAFADKAAYMGDTDFVKVPINGLINPQYADSLAQTIDMARATPSAQVKAGLPSRFEAPETTHFTIIDKDGNVVTNTYTLNGLYGCGATVKGTGVLLNNEMDDFTSKPGAPNMFGLVQGEANAIAPGKRPLSAMAPTIVLKDGKVRFALGSPGGPTIINTVLQVIINVIDFDMDISQAIAQPRFHHQWLPDAILWEPFGVSKETRAELERRGHRFADKPMAIGDAQAIAVDPRDGTRQAASDPRQGGIPVGN